MGVDLYVGTLTRYFAGDWKTVVQQMMETGTLSAQFKPKHEPLDPSVDRQAIQTDVDRWRARIASRLRRPLLGRKVTEPFDWNESLGAPYFTDKPGWWGYGGLLAVALRAEGRAISDQQISEQWVLSLLARALPGGRRYPHLLGSHAWLPLEIDRPFRASWPAGRSAFFGSSPGLATELKELNERTYRAQETELVEWRKGDGPDDLADWSLDQMARFGLAVFVEFARQAVAERLPMLLDY